MLVKTYCAAVNGLDVTTVTCEISMTRGIQFHLTGLADTAVKESYERIKAAMLNNGFKFPTMDITVNLAPADIKKKARATISHWLLAFWLQITKYCPTNCRTIC